MTVASTEKLFLGGVHHGCVAHSSVPWAHLASVGLAVLGAVLVVGGMAIAQGSARATTYAGASAVSAVLAPVAASALIIAGLVHSLSARSARRIGRLALLAAVAWLAQPLIGWEGGPTLIRSVATLGADLLLPVVIHAAVAFPLGVVGPRGSRLLVLAAYAGAALPAVGLAIFRDPFFDPDCWANCSENAFLLRSLPNVARAIEVTERWIDVVVIAAFAIHGVRRLILGSGPTRRVLAPVVGSALLVATAIAARSTALGLGRVEDPMDLVFLSAFALTSVGLALFGAGLLWVWLRTRLQRRAVAEIVANLGEAPTVGSLDSALAGAIGDPDLRIAYWLGASDRFVDANGRPLPEPVAGPGRVVTALTREGRRFALVSHASGLPSLGSEMGPAVRLALENERLKAEGLAQLEELRVSRTRIVATADAERRRLERDLHDGAQQSLLAVSYEIRMARDRSDAAEDDGAGAALTRALDGVQAVLDELRDVAHGIYPAILGEAGFRAAVATLADVAPLRIAGEAIPEERYPEAVETAAYVVVVEALEDAFRRGAVHATVTASREGPVLVVGVRDDGPPRTSELVAIRDRVGALGGSVKVGPTSVEAAMPCV